MDNKTIIQLIETGNNLAERAREYSFKKHQKGDIYKMLDLVLCDYCDWKDKVIKFLKQNKIGKLTILNIKSSDTLFVNPTDWATKAIDPKTKTTAIRLYINNVNNIIKELSAVYTSQENKNDKPTPVSENSNKIKITISDKGIYRIKDGKELIYKSRKNSDRRKVIDYLLNIKKPTPAEELKNKFEFTDKELLSKEIGEINRLFMLRLMMPDVKDNYLIINYQTGEGYFFNKEKYFFE